jgi:hypothetical protein
MLGIGVGAATIDPATSGTPSPTAFSITAAVWWTVAGIIAAFLGGHAAGRLSGRPKESTAGWHGLTTWAVTTIVIFFLLSSTVGAILGGAFSARKSTIGGVGQAAVQTAAPAIAGANVPFGAIERQIRERSGGTDPQALRDAAVAAVRAAVTGNQAEAQAARDRAAEAIAKAQNVSADEARAQVAQYEEQYRQAVERTKQQATQAAEKAANATSKGAIFGFIALVLGAIAGWLGGRMGAVDPTMTADAEIIPARRQV